MKLEIQERLLILNMMPEQGTIEHVKARISLLPKVILTEEEVKKWDVRKVEGNVVKWDEKRAQEKEIEISKEEKEAVAKALLKLDHKEELDRRYISIYEKFVKG